MVLLEHWQRAFQHLTEDEGEIAILRLLHPPLTSPPEGVPQAQLWTLTEVDTISKGSAVVNN